MHKFQRRCFLWCSACEECKSGTSCVSHFSSWGVLCRIVYFVSKVFASSQMSLHFAASVLRFQKTWNNINDVIHIFMSVCFTLHTLMMKFLGSDAFYVSIVVTYSVVISESWPMPVVAILQFWFLSVQHRFSLQVEQPRLDNSVVIGKCDH